MRDEPSRVLIVTAGMGAGHLAVAAELARRLRERGCPVELMDIVADVPGAGPRLRRTYRLLLDHAPWLYDAAMRCWARYPGPFERLTAAGDHRFAATLRHAVARHEPDVIVSTFNLASQCLGRMRLRGEVAVPVITVLPDPGAHPYWVSKGVDLHLAYLPRTVADLEALGATARLVRPALRPEFTAPPNRERARAELGFTGRVVLVNGGAWAAGGITAAVDALAGEPELTVAVLCGRNEQVRRSLTGRDGVVVLGWTEDMAGHLAAADVLVDNAGGVTCCEALSLGCAVVLFRPLAGHGRINARVLAETGLAGTASTPDALRTAVRNARPREFVASGPDPADLVLEMVTHRA